MLHHARRIKRKGAALVEYALLIGGVALVCAASVAIFGHKTNDMVALMAAVLPGAHTDDNGPIISGKIIETTPNGVGAGGTAGIALDMQAAVNGAGQERLGNQLGVGNGLVSQLVIEHGP
jgi:pilus assembly protein Flp/PilA